jgi:hypothetical protein
MKYIMCIHRVHVCKTRMYHVCIASSNACMQLFFARVPYVCALCTYRCVYSCIHACYAYMYAIHERVGCVLCTFRCICACMDAWMHADAGLVDCLRRRGTREYIRHELVHMRHRVCKSASSRACVGPLRMLQGRVCACSARAGFTTVLRADIYTYSGALAQLRNGVCANAGARAHAHAHTLTHTYIYTFATSYTRTLPLIPAMAPIVCTITHTRCTRVHARLALYARARRHDAYANACTGPTG